MGVDRATANKHGVQLRHYGTPDDLCTKCMVWDKTAYTRWNLPLPKYQIYSRNFFQYDNEQDGREIMGSRTGKRGNKLVTKGYKSVFIMSEVLNLYLDACHNYDTKETEIEPWNDP